MKTGVPVKKGLDIRAESDPDWIYSQVPKPAEAFDPAETDDPHARKLMIELRRAAGLPDYPSDEDRRRAAD